ncbi:MAG: hypothetical protein ABJB86_24300 [Bacteroidota bacterium]
MTQFIIQYKDQPVSIIGEGHSYRVSVAGKKTITIEQMADGWYKVEDKELYWTDHDVAAMGALIEIENPSNFPSIPFN